MKEVDRGGRQQNPEQPNLRGKGKGEGLDEELLNETAAACAQRCSDRQLFAAGGGAREKQAGKDVGAGDQEQEADGSEKSEESGSHVSDHCVRQRHNGGGVGDQHLFRTDL